MDTDETKSEDTVADDLGVTPPPVLEIKIRLKGFKTRSFSGKELLRYTLLPNTYEVLAVIKGETVLTVIPLDRIKSIDYKFASTS